MERGGVSSKIRVQLLPLTCVAFLKEVPESSKKENGAVQEPAAATKKKKRRVEEQEAAQQLPVSERRNCMASVQIAHE